jgi:hypothetical protein
MFIIRTTCTYWNPSCREQFGGGVSVLRCLLTTPIVWGWGIDFALLSISWVLEDVYMMFFCWLQQCTMSHGTYSSILRGCGDTRWFIPMLSIRSCSYISTVVDFVNCVLLLWRLDILLTLVNIIVNFVNGGEKCLFLLYLEKNTTISRQRSSIWIKSCQFHNSCPFQQGLISSLVKKGWEFTHAIKSGNNIFIIVLSEIVNFIFFWRGIILFVHSRKLNNWIIRSFFSFSSEQKEPLYICKFTIER